MKKLNFSRLLAKKNKLTKSDHQIRAEKFRAYVDSLPDFDFAPKTWKFWRNSFLIFMIGSFVGRIIESSIWIGVVNFNPEWQSSFFPVIAEPFGLGAVAIIWFIYPLVCRQKLGVFGAFVAGALMATFIEFICAAVITFAIGHNPYWDYSGVTQFHLFGFVCLHNSILFGLGALVCIYFFYLWLVKWMDRLGKVAVNIATIVLMVWYSASLLSQLFFGIRLFL